MKYNFLTLAEEILKRTKLPMSVNEIWNYAEKNNMTKELNSSGKTPWQTLGARMYVDIKRNNRSKFEQLSKRPAKFGLRELKYDLETTEKETGQNDNEKYNERDLHPLLAKYVYSNQHFKCYTKTIFHEKSKKRGQGVNKWLHPDIVGIHFPYDEYSKETIELIKSFNQTTYKLYSFEMKKYLNFENLREYYFQAVSNSSWANEGYLVVLKMDETDEFIDEIRRLNNAFGIGVIKLNAINIAESEILFPARFNNTLDWDTIDRLSEDNIDFKNFSENISDSNKINKVGRDYDKILDDEKYEKYLEDKKIVKAT
ncbi:MAG: HrgA protein [Clostridia bacterium]|jgi:hypothetical protein|nr:HrgA protein [Clostridia bacterium]